VTVTFSPLLSGLAGGFHRKLQSEIESIQKLIDSDWLGEIPEESSSRAFFDILGHCLGADCHKGKVNSREVWGTDFQGADAADTRQISVHQSDVRLVTAQRDLIETVVYGRALGEADREGFQFSWFSLCCSHLAF